MTMRWTRPAGLALGYLADQLFGDPRRGHPVAGFGQLAARLEEQLHADSRARGVLYTAGLVGAATGLGVLVESATARRPVLHLAATAAGTWVVLGATSLGREAAAVHDLLAADDLPGARQRLTHLVGRDTTSLSEAEIARAVIESVAENTSDAVTAPLVLGAVFGLPGLLGHRAANTLDAMVGHRTSRHERFGWASARLDDLLNLPGSRFGAALTVVLAPLVSGSPAAAARAWSRDAPGHPSPNAGPIEAAFAGALDVQLGGVNTYGDRVEDRHRLGSGPPPRRGDIDRARRLARHVSTGAAVAAAAVSWLRPRPGRAPS